MEGERSASVKARKDCSSEAIFGHPFSQRPLLSQTLKVPEIGADSKGDRKSIETSCWEPFPTVDPEP